MEPIYFIDRCSGQKVREAVYGGRALQVLYGSGCLGRLLRDLVSRFALSSRFVGWWQHRSWTKRQIKPFVETYGIDTSEFLDPIERFQSFNDFFIRKLKPQARPIAEGDIAVMPADGRYRFFPHLRMEQPVDIKGRQLNLNELLGNSLLAQQYEGGSLVMARLCPTDYHRFHFPMTCVPGASQLINGPLFSVNPIAIRQNIRIFSENKRMLTPLGSLLFGDVYCIEVGATTVGSIQQTYTPNILQEKGAEKGFFAFGGSAMLLLFPPNRITFDADLLAAMRHGLEIRCLMGQRMGVVTRI